MSYSGVEGTMGPDNRLQRTAPPRRNVRLRWEDSPCKSPRCQPGEHFYVAVLQAVVAGTVGAIAMMPVGLVFRAFQMRVGHYGPKFAELYLSSPGPAALFVQHIVLGWISAVPLVVSPLPGRMATIAGATYGALYYLLVNALALPIYFADALPWNLGWSVVVPSLVVHVVFGVAVAHTVRVLRRR